MNSEIRENSPDVAAIIPVLGDADPLRDLLDTFRRMSDGPREVIVVDGAGDECCRVQCRERGARYLSSRPGRGHQLHCGALAAEADVVWFVHADAVPPPDAIALIRRQLARGATGGYFRFRFTGNRSWYKSLLATLINLRSRWGVPYGDQGLFATRAAYVRAGGFPDVPLFEEVPLVKALRRLGRFRPLGAAIGVSPRRWEQDGWMRRTLENRLLALGYALGVPPARLAQRYRPLDSPPRPAGGPQP